MQVGPTCKELKPCDPGVVCKNICTAPFYECVPCDKNQQELFCKKPTGMIHFDVLLYLLEDNIAVF